MTSQDLPAHLGVNESNMVGMGLSQEGSIGRG